MTSTKQKIALVLILLLSFLLFFVNLHKEEFGNQYYSAAVKNMQKSFSNFFFAAADSEGFVTVDKPPLGLWIQSLFALIFGFSGLAVHIPQALAGVLSVFLLYCIVKQKFGVNTGLLSALILACTPIFVAVGRTNNLDSLLLLTVLLSSYFMLKGLEKKPILFFIISLVLIGIGFNIKMLQAYMVLPAIYLVFLFIKNLSIPKKILTYLLGTIVLLLVSLSWALIVDSVPEKNRPYISNSKENSVMDLILGANGIFRITNNGADLSSTINIPQPVQDPQALIDSGMPLPGLPQGASLSPQMKAWLNSLSKRLLPDNSDARFKKNPFAFEVGFPGIFRLFNFSLGPQISWFLLFVLIFLVSLIRRPGKNDLSSEGLHILFWAAWLIPAILYFSFTSGLFHRYYVIMLAPPIAALTGIGIFHLKKLFESNQQWKGYLLPLGILVTGVFESFILFRYGGPVIIPGILLLILSIIFSAILVLKKLNSKMLKNKLYITILSSLLFFPFLWSLTPLLMGVFSPLPFAGPELLMMGKMGNTGDPLARFMPGFMGERKTYEKLSAFLNKTQTTEKFLIAVPSVTTYGSAMMVHTDNPILLLGGFTGEDTIFTLAEIQKMITDKEVRFFIVSSLPKGKNKEIYEWIIKTGKPVPKEEWSLYPSNDELYDLKLN